MQHKNDNGMQYLQQYPDLKKWINTYICCGQSGYDPNMPEVLTANWGQGEVKTAKAYYIRKYFHAMIWESVKRVKKSKADYEASGMEWISLKGNSFDKSCCLRLLFCRRIGAVRV